MKPSGMRILVIMQRCQEMDISLPNEVSESTVPTGSDLYLEEGLDCYQNNEGSVDAIDVGGVTESLCGTIGISLKIVPTITQHGCYHLL